MAIKKEPKMNGVPHFRDREPSANALSPTAAPSLGSASRQHFPPFPLAYSATNGNHFDEDDEDEAEVEDRNLSPTVVKMEVLDEENAPGKPCGSPDMLILRSHVDRRHVRRNNSPYLRQQIVQSRGGVP